MHDDAALVEADRRARREALDVGRSFIVQAPAGSGKTELLIQRYLCLLATVESPEDILAITFTRKAAAEMRERVVDALRRARAGCSGNLDHERTTLAAARDVLKKDRSNDWRLIDSPRRMRIQTLDAFCAGTARALPLTSGLGGSPSTVQGAEANALYRKAALATLDWLVGEEEVGRAVEEVLTHLDNNTGAYVAYLSQMLLMRDQWLEITGSGDVRDSTAVRARLEGNIAGVVRRYLRNVRRLLLEAGAEGVAPLCAYAAENLLALDKADHPAAELANRSTIADARPEELAAWRGLADLLLTQKGTWRKSVNRNQGFPPGDQGQKKDWLAITGRLSGDSGLGALLHTARSLPDAHYDDQQWQVLLALFTLLPLAVSELKRLFAEQGICDHAEVALAAGAALGSSEVPGDAALLLDYRIQHLLVDEMQDTSISQYRLLETLIAGWQPDDGRTFFCVGDPMQSIYRFRNAEVGRFVQAREAGIGHLPLESLTLRRNFRSGEHLVHWFNTVFGQIFPRRDDMASGAVSYAESVPVDALLGIGKYDVYPLLDADVAEEAKETAAIVERCLDGSDDEDLAILVRSRTQLPVLLAELRRLRIDYRAIEIDRLTDLPEIIDVQALTRACCHLGDRAAWLALLRGPLVGLGWMDLHRLVLDAAGEVIWDLLADSQRIAKLSPFAQQAIADFVPKMHVCLASRRNDTLRQRIESAWFRLGGPGLLDDEEQLANVYRYLDVLEGIELAGTLPDPAELQQLLDDERVSSRGARGCRVQVMTMHKAKGLEFDHVVLPSLGRFTTGSSRAVLNWLNIPADDGGSDMVISPVGPSFELERDPLHQYIENAQRLSDRLEQDRLLYVACTRAKKSLHLIGNVSIAGDGDALRTPHSGSLLNRLWPALEPVITSSAIESGRSPDVDGATAGDDGLYAVPALKRAIPGWKVPAAQALPGSRHDRLSALEAVEHRVEYYWVGAIARHAGSVVHKWLQRFAERGTWPAPDRLDETDGLTRLWARALGVGEPDLDAVCGRVRRALSGMLSDQRGLWILDGPGHAELPLTGVSDGRALSVVIDRVRIDGATHWIIDYKTSTHEGGDLRGFLQQESERYAPQLACYAELYRDYAQQSQVRTALYFPLMQQFEEVAVAD